MILCDQFGQTFMEIEWDLLKTTKRLATFTWYNTYSTKVHLSVIIYLFFNYYASRITYNYVSSMCSEWSVHYTYTGDSTKVRVSICPLGAVLRLQRSLSGVKFKVKRYYWLAGRKVYGGLCHRCWH